MKTVYNIHNTGDTATQHNFLPDEAYFYSWVGEFPEYMFDQGSRSYIVALWKVKSLKPSDDMVRD